MRGRNTIIINGKVYDAVSGLPVAAPDHVTKPAESAKPAPKLHNGKAFSDIGPAIKVNQAQPGAKIHHHAKTVHRKVQRSQTLRRDVLKQPATTVHHSLRRKPTTGHVAQSALISKFAPHPQVRETAPAKKPVVVAAKPAVSTKSLQPAQSHASALSSREYKEKLISERLASIDHKRHTQEVRPRRSLFAAHPRMSGVIAGCVALVLLGGYLTYLNMPNLSVRVAAAQSGVAASFPQYRPDGYRFDGPIAYAPGEVIINFQANGGPQKFTIKQKSSSWDSQAVLDNYVAKNSANDYITSSENGLTIYTFDNKAAWVNKGVFYSIEGNAPLSSDQVLHIAASM